MPEAHELIHSFNVGEVSQAGLARVDNQRIRLAAEIQENIFPFVIGKGQVRQGSEYLGGTYTNAKARLIPHVRSVTSSSVLEFSNGLLRVWDGITGDLIERASVTSTVTSGDFSSASGWTLTPFPAAAAIASITGGSLILYSYAEGATATAAQAVVTSSAGTEHALRVKVTLGAVTFKVGSAAGEDDYITTTELGVGEHSLAFTPTGATYYITLGNVEKIYGVVDSCQIESAGVVSLTAPWTEAQLWEIQYAQSVDVMFLGHESWKQRKIERRAAGRSWSLVDYDPLDGPFGSTNTTTTTVYLAEVYGLSTLYASTPTFSASDVGSVFRLFTTGYNSYVYLAASETYTPAIRVSGLATDQSFSVVRSGTWGGTLTLQRSYDGPDSGFIDVGAASVGGAAVTYTGNGTTTINPTSSFDNVETWYRVGFKTGAYGSGAAYVGLVWTGGGGSAGVVRITSITSSTQATVQVLSSPSAKNTNTRNWSRGAWSTRAGWPSAVALYDGRIFWGGSDRFWASASDAYYTFGLDEDLGDAGSIQRNIATGGQVNEVQWMLPLQRLIFGTTGAEVSARSSSFDEPLTPTNLTLKDASTQGVAARSPVRMDSRGIYIHRSRRHSYEIVYDFENNDYRATRLTQYNEDIGEPNFSELAIQRSPESYIWHVRDDGICAVLLHDVRQEAAGWFKFISAPTIGGDAVVESVAVVPTSTHDSVFLAIKRIVNGSTVRYVERLNF